MKWSRYEYIISACRSLQDSQFFTSLSNPPRTLPPFTNHVVTNWIYLLKNKNCRVYLLNWFSLQLAVFVLRSQFPPWCHSLRRWKWDTANTKTPITIWSTLPTSHRPCITCYSRLGWWWVDWNVYLSVKKKNEITQSRLAVRHCLADSRKTSPYPNSILISLSMFFPPHKQE